MEVTTSLFIALTISNVAELSLLTLLYMHEHFAFRKLQLNAEFRHEQVVHAEEAVNKVAEIADTLRKRQEVLAKELATKTAATDKQVQSTLADIQIQLVENTAMTVKAADASAEAASVANHMNDKIVKTHEEVLSALAQVVAPVDPPLSEKIVDKAKHKV